MNDIIRTQNLCKHYKETIALDNVSLHIPRGAIYGLIGNNGAGKTTLMRILSNLQSPSSGTVVKSENIKIGAIIETPALYPTLSAKGNLKYQLKICGCPSKEVKSKIAELLELVHLKDTRKLVMNYSLGMRQRLALAMALVGNPQFLILDEPLNGLDPEGIKDVRAIIAKLNEEYGVMVIGHFLVMVKCRTTFYTVPFIKTFREKPYHIICLVLNKTFWKCNDKLPSFNTFSCCSTCLKIQLILSGKILPELWCCSFRLIGRIEMFLSFRIRNIVNSSYHIRQLVLSDK